MLRRLYLLNVLHFSVKSPYYTGVAYCWGYFGSAIRREKKIQDPEVRAYYKNQGFGVLLSRISRNFSRNSRDLKEREQ